MQSGQLFFEVQGRMNNESTLPLEISCGQVKAQMDSQSDLVLLDCREKNEVDFVALADSFWIPMNQFQDRLAELDQHRERQIVVYCHLGARSLHVARWLRDQGFSRAQSMAGGIDQWSLDVEPGLPRY